MKIFLIRHANTSYNTKGVWQGRSDFPLDEKGREMAKALAYRLASENISRVIASPLTRARQTAEEIARVHGIEVETDERLIEADLSIWEGMKTEEVLEKYRETYKKWKSDPDFSTEGLEPFSSVYARIKDFFENLEVDENGDIAVVTHAIAIRAAVCYVMKMPLKSFREFIIGTASITTILIKDGWWRILNLNDRSHLRGWVT